MKLVALALTAALTSCAAAASGGRFEVASTTATGTAARVLMSMSHGPFGAEIDAGITCSECEHAVADLVGLVREQSVDDVVRDVAELVCLAGHGGFGWSCTGTWACHDLCSGITARFTPVVADIASRAIKPLEVCTALKMCNSTSIEAPAATKPTLKLAEPVATKPAASVPSQQGGNRTLLRVLHISDLHWDPNHTVGARTDCGEPDCCRGVQGMATNASNACGYWGDHAGDATTPLVQSMLEFASTLDPDLILQTGDVPPHMVWNITSDNVRDLYLNFSSMIHAAMPGVPVAMTAGNHEGLVIDQFNTTSFGPGSVGSTRLWEPVSELAAAFGWLDEQARQQLSYAGYYSWRVPNMTSGSGGGLVLVAMHPGLHQSGNWYSKLNQSIDLGGEASFMADAIDTAAAAGDTVWILTHHPLNDGGYDSAFMETFLAPLIAKHPGVVRHVFSGHTHKAQTQILWRNDTSSVLEPIATSYVVAAPTPFGSVNPTFRMLLVDPDTLTVESYTDYTVDLSLHKNQLTPEPRPKWQPRCSAPADFNMTGMAPSDWHAFAERMKTDDVAFRTWELCYHTSNAAAADFSAAEREVRVCDMIGGTHALVQACHEGRINATFLSSGN